MRGNAHLLATQIALTNFTRITEGFYQLPRAEATNGTLRAPLACSETAPPSDRRRGFRRRFSDLFVLAFLAGTDTTIPAPKAVPTPGTIAPPTAGNIFDPYNCRNTRPDTRRDTRPLNATEPARSVRKNDPSDRPIGGKIWGFTHHRPANLKRTKLG